MHHRAHHSAATLLRRLAPVAFALGLVAPPAQAQAPAGLQACAAEPADAARLACYDRLARESTPGPRADSPPPAEARPVAARKDPEPVQSAGGCHDTTHSELSRFWELERATGCGVFGIRSYRPISLSVIGSNAVDKQPISENPLNNSPTSQPYRTTETRIQLSVRSKLAEGLLTQGDLRDSLWFGYTQQSYWQLFTDAISRPFRNTDHEPEFIYVHPLQLPTARGWSLRYGGVGLVHQSNGQTLPLSRSWNRVYLMAGAENGPFTFRARVWQRLNEDVVSDDNPRISDFIGRGEAIGSWRMASGQTLSLTVRHSLRQEARGSARLEWMLPIGGEHGASAPSSMRLHAQLFSGYGDSLLDYNRRRTVLSLGLSLVDW